jgi:hypothetical protein
LDAGSEIRSTTASNLDWNDAVEPLTIDRGLT